MTEQFLGVVLHDSAMSVTCSSGRVHREFSTQLNQ